ncbi:MAG: hypothetical protein M0Z32_00170 [Actinomycetota bacterium]|nr:hypothetical protein [Actinomycetota bacterium]MCL6093568.1 hypothetical protein [Actinomycetota bacterium]MDA8166164.1 hypothetical protein [Actinomycetota bacterium]
MNEGHYNELQYHEDDLKKRPKNPQLRITTWPESKVSVPAAYVFPVWLCQDEFLIFENRPGDPVVLPDELYLRELKELDLHDPKAILDFSRKYGRFGWTDWELDRDSSNDINSDLLELLKTQAQAFTRNVPIQYLDSELIAVRQVDEFIFYAAMLRDMTRAWQLYKRQLSLEDFFNEMESDWLKPLLEQAKPHKGEDWILLLLLGNLLNRGLKAFQVRLEIDFNIDNAFPVGQPVPDLFSLLCLQLANHINENATYKPCGNETCKNVFVRQRGRASGKRYRLKGVDYCDYACAKSQAQRDLRRRQAKTRRLHRDGASPEAIAKQLNADLASVKRWISKK